MFPAGLQPAGFTHILRGVVFEVQIKTILQHAWSLATHDLIYKTDTVSWPLERIAYQVKAMLEHAEVAIAEANELARTPAVAKRDPHTTALLFLIGEIKRTWSNDRLPTDIKRLAETILKVFQAVDLDVRKFREVIGAEIRRFGTLPYDLSPYAFTIQALAHFAGTDFQQKLSRAHMRLSILIHGGMDLPSWMFEEHPRIIQAKT